MSFVCPIIKRCVKAHFIKPSILPSYKYTRLKNQRQIRISSLYSNKILQEAGDSVEGLVIAIPWFRNAVKSINFTQKAEKQWGVEVGWYTASSFDATQAFIESFKLSPNVSTATVLANLPNVKLSSNHTSGEELIFDKNTREMKRDEKLLMVKNRKFVVIPEPN